VQPPKKGASKTQRAYLEAPNNLGRPHTHIETETREKGKRVRPHTTGGTTPPESVENTRSQKRINGENGGEVNPSRNPPRGGPWGPILYSKEKR